MNRKEGNQMNQQVTYDIYIGNVPANITEVDIREIFGNFGEIKQVLCRWKEDYFGYGIVKFIHKQDADRVLRETEEITWNGHSMPVKEARRSEHNYSNGNSGMDSRTNAYPDMNKNLVFTGSKFSNTDYGYFHHPTYNNEQLSYSQPMMLEVLCTSVEDAISFYGCPVNRSDELAMIMNALCNLNFNQNRLERRPSVKKVYAALFSEDKSWYRCSVIQSVLPNKPGMCSVRYIDYGNQEETSIRNIVEIPEALQKIPPMASKFIFSNLVCDNNPSNKKSCLHQLLNKRMTLCAYVSFCNREYHVVKCSSNGKDVILDTINKGYARLQRSSVPSRHEAPNYDFNSKAKAYACGSEIRLSPTYNADPSPQGYIPKPHEAPSVNSSSSSNKKVRKNQPKTKEISPKNEIVCNGTSDDLKKESDFHPKMIIKRGSDLEEVVKRSVSVSPPKEKNPHQHSSSPYHMLDTVIPNIKLINNIRSLVSQSSDDSIINNAVDLLKNEISTREVTETAIKCVDDALKDYMESIVKIKKCTDKEDLLILTSERNAHRIHLCDKLKEYLGSCDSTIFERKEKIQKIITDLESNSNAWMNVQLHKKPENVDELVHEYRKVKDERWNLVSKTRTNTNQRHNNFMNILETLQKEFHLNTLEEENEVSDTDPNVHSINRTISYSDQLNGALVELGKAVDEEIHTLTLNKDGGDFSVIRCLLDILDIHKEKIDSLCDLYENRYAMYNDLSKLPNIEETLSELQNAEKLVHGILEDLTIRQVITGGNSQPEVPALRKDLHRALLKEDLLKGVLAKVSESHFPELYLEHPELNLSIHLQKRFLLKNWKSSYFLNFGTGPRGNSSYVSCLLDEPVTIKDYSFENVEECNTFIQKAVLWNDVKSDSLVKIKALFFKDEKTISVILPPFTNSLMRNATTSLAVDGEKACRILRHILIGLRDIHSEGLVHHAVHPSTVVVENERALLDFCFDPDYITDSAILNGIRFLSPEHKAIHASADMYGFGCLVLWVLFPNLSFTATVDRVPNVSAFRSIIEELILPKDYALLCALMDANPERRPSSCTLLNKGFLSKYEAYCRSRCDTPKSA